MMPNPPESRGRRAWWTRGLLAGPPMRRLNAPFQTHRSELLFYEKYTTLCAHVKGIARHGGRLAAGARRGQRTRNGWADLFGPVGPVRKPPAVPAASAGALPAGRFTNRPYR